MKTLKILKRDFDEAVKQPFSVGTCLIAQFAIRNGIELQHGDACWLASEIGVRTTLMATFDKHFLEPKDKNKRELQALRAQLPVTVELKAKS